MNKKTILALVLLALAVMLILATAFFMLRVADVEPGLMPGTTFPSGGIVSTDVGSGARTEVAGPDGSMIPVRDFVHNGETVADVVNPGNYVLAGELGYCLADGDCPAGADTEDFSVSYDGSTQSFTVVLLAEPLRDVREEAEAFLRDRLGIAQQDLCRLSYYLGTPYWVNERFTGENLGFSSCPGAVELP